MIWKPQLDMSLMALLYDVAQLDKGILSSPVSNSLVEQMASVVDAMNSFYSNAIEGVHTKITDVDAVLKKHKKSEHQALSMAHVAISKGFSSITYEDVFSPAFIKQIHADFFDRLSDEYRTVKYPDGYQKLIQGGEFRANNVSVGDHQAVSYTKVDSLMNEFHQQYSSDERNLGKFLNALSSHHRLVWIHPFSDGNGRTARLHTQASMMQADVGKSRLWSISRGLAFQLPEYYQSLGDADSLTESSLYRFVEFLGETCKDQCQFMAKKLDTRLMKDAYLNLAKSLDMPKGMENVVDMLLVVGDLERSSLANYLGKSDRTARDFVKKMSSVGLLQTSQIKGGVINLGLSPVVAAIVLPELFPISETIRAQKYLEDMVKDLQI